VSYKIDVIDSYNAHLFDDLDEIDYEYLSLLKNDANFEEIRSAAYEANALKFIENNDFEGVTNDIPEGEKHDKEQHILE
jgi:hypothetical protein